MKAHENQLRGWWYDKRRFRFVLGLYPVVDAWIDIRFAVEGAKTATRLENPDPFLQGLQYLINHIAELTR